MPFVINFVHFCPLFMQIYQKKNYMLKESILQLYKDLRDVLRKVFQRYAIALYFFELRRETNVIMLLKLLPRESKSPEFILTYSFKLPMS